MNITLPDGKAVNALRDALVRDFLAKDLSLPSEYSYGSVPLCIVDSVFSIQSRYPTTQATVRRWAAYANWPLLKGSLTDEHTVSDFLEKMAGLDAENLASNIFQNRQRTSSTSGILKSQAVREFAEALVQEKLERFSDFEDRSRLGRAETLIRKIKGQGSGVTWKYFLMMAGGDEFIKPDTWICRYVARVTSRVRVDAPEAEALLLAAIAIIKTLRPEITPRQIDHAIWNSERSRPLTNETSR